MSVLPQDLMRKISAASRESSERTSSSEAPGKRFRELMKVMPTDERSQKNDICKNRHEDEDEEEENNLSPAPFAALPAILTPQDLQKQTSTTSLAPCSLVLETASSMVSAPGIEALFERMASEMLVMCSSGETETTLFLDSSHFASSIFFGTEITIREFSTAPKAFNIEITSTSAALAVLDAGKQGLLAAFQNGKFNFSVHRIDTLVKQNEDRPVLHRKESGDHGQQDRKGGRQQ